MSKFKIDTTTKKGEFNDHLSIENNQRIVFNGPFGSGKTTFLKEFFRNNSEYIAFHLYPVNYSVSRNEDIFELIKLDILYELFKYPVQFDDVKVSQIDAFSQLSADEALDLINKFIKIIPSVGKPLADILTALQSLSNKVYEKKKDIEGLNESAFIKSFISNLEKKKGHQYEFDTISNLIYNLINRLKSNGEKKEENSSQKIVLIIDDFDRLDPEHVFRILNIFSAHIDYSEATNKFGFDKIIFSLDINNIAEMYAHRYGKDVDFLGYIEKFYSIDIFKFSLVDKFVKDTNTFIHSLSIEPKELFEGFRDEMKFAIKYFIYSGLTSESIKIRTLIKLMGNCYHIQSKNYNIRKDEIKSCNFFAIIFFEILNELFGDDLHEIIRRTNFPKHFSVSWGIVKQNIYFIIFQLILLIELKKILESNDLHSIEVNKSQFRSQKYKFLYDVSVNYNNYYANSVNTNEEIEIYFSKLDLNEIVNSAFEAYKNLEIFNKNH